MKTSMVELCPTFNVDRMVHEYAIKTYFPATARYTEFLADGASRAKKLAEWKHGIQHSWRDVAIESVQTEIPDTVRVGDDMKIRATVHLGALKPADVSVQIYHGPIDAYNNIINGDIAAMTAGEQADGRYIFNGDIKYHRSGRHGFTVRVIPHNSDLSSPFETGLIQWASQSQLSESPKIMQSV
jgi:starch phosphorylase